MTTINIIIPIIGILLPIIPIITTAITIMFTSSPSSHHHHHHQLTITWLGKLDQFYFSDLLWEVMASGIMLNPIQPPTLSFS